MTIPTKFSWTIFYVTTLHLIWGILLLLDNSPFSTNPIGFFEIFLSQTATAVLFLFAGILAILAYKIKISLNSFILLVPQQILLLLTSFSGIRSALKGHYIDGVIRPGIFIITDQLPIILLSFVYGLAIYEKLMIDK